MGLYSIYVRTGGGSSDYTTGSGVTNIYIYICNFTASIYVQTYVINASVRRIKEEIDDVNDDGALQKILALRLRTYILMK